MPTRLAVATDPVLLERVLRNLLANAVRYTPAGGIVLGARRRGRAVRIDVVDTGIGIAESDATRVFDEFVQLAAAPRNHAGGRGLGLGLAIVRKLATLCGHSVELASTPGRGSRFSITVPRARSLDDEGRRRRPAPAADPASSLTLSGRRIVVVDDDPAVVAAMQALFASWNAVATGGSDAMTAMASLADGDTVDIGTVDLIVADLRLADGKSGIDAIARLRAGLGAGIPAIVVSGDTSAAAQAEVRAARVELLVKPVVAAALKEAAERAIIPRNDGAADARIRADAQERTGTEPSTPCRTKKRPGTWPGPRRTSTGKSAVRSSSARLGAGLLAHVLAHLLVERFHARHSLLQEVAHDRLLVGVNVA